MLVPVLQPSSRVPMGHALLYLQPRIRAVLLAIRITRWEEFSSQLQCG